jgi:hypothetical protein
MLFAGDRQGREPQRVSVIKGRLPSQNFDVCILFWIVEVMEVDCRSDYFALKEAPIPVKGAKL